MSATQPTGRVALEGEISLLEVVNVLLRRWRIVAGLPFATVVLVVGLSFLVPPTYTATTSFVPEARSQTRVPAGLIGLAGQFGIPLGSDASQSPRFYADVAMSREILDRVLLAPYSDPRATGGAGELANLMSILGEGGRNVADSLERAARKLARLLSVGVDAQTSIVTVRTESPYPDLAAAVGNRLVTSLNDFNTQTRQSQARERRKFAEQRVAAGERDLREAEEALKRFYQANRSWQQSPQLTFEESQLRRQVDLSQELYVTLRREYESARIEEVNDTPVITVIDTAAVPQRKSSPKRTLWAILALAVSGMVAVMWALGGEYVDRARREQQEPYRELVATLRRLRSELAQGARAIVTRSEAKGR